MKLVNLKVRPVKFQYTCVDIFSSKVPFRQCGRSVSSVKYDQHRPIQHIRHFNRPLSP